MKILKLFTINFFVLICFSCKKNMTTGKNLTSKGLLTDSTFTKMKNNLPYTSDSIKQYYKLDMDSVSYVVNTTYKGLSSNHFDEKNRSLPLKENDFDIILNSKIRFYTLEDFRFSDQNIAKLVIYNTFGENDSKILNVQLNSYMNNILTDQLLLDCRFTFETEYYRTFVINKNNNIKIFKHTVDKLEYNDAGDIVGEKKNGDSTEVIVDYIIDGSGKFIKK